MPIPQQQNVVLIGMPGSGKSTVGVVLAKRTGRGFVDTDLLIQAAEGRTLQQIVDTDGYVALRLAEEAALVGLRFENHVVATGGSAVYSSAGMKNLKAGGVVVYLDVALATLHDRVGDYSARGIAMRADQSFEDLYEERVALYQSYADLTIDGNGPTTEAVCERIEAALGG